MNSELGKRQSNFEVPSSGQLSQDFVFGPCKEIPQPPKETYKTPMSILRQTSELKSMKQKALSRLTMGMSTKKLQNQHIDAIIYPLGPSNEDIHINISLHEKSRRFLFISCRKIPEC